MPERGTLIFTVDRPSTRAGLISNTMSPLESLVTNGASNRLGVFEESALGNDLESVLAEAPNELAISSVDRR